MNCLFQFSLRERLYGVGDPEEAPLGNSFLILRKSFNSLKHLYICRFNFLVYREFLDEPPYFFWLLEIFQVLDLQPCPEEPAALSGNSLESIM